MLENNEIKPCVQQGKGARPRGTDSARLIVVIETKALAGAGLATDDIARIKTQYWSLNGTLLAES
ncbi:hypothetical protein [Phascolarctobacterium faecium]|jgi:hypothetical protein|uniref:hypothetical protein n=1 Tax=Phascolarctobacterium faecium TaxID=33025 RepID=UPI002FDD5FBD